MTTMFQDVMHFHTKFNLPSAQPGAHYRRPQLLNSTEYMYRFAFLKEELLEFAESHGNADLEGAADALADLVWVALGTAHYMGLPMDEIWEEVRRANMDKILAAPNDSMHKRGAVETIRKPPDWKAPELMPIIDRAFK
jgi:predicted HAD superfamily Cof-like phosphohydrolase